MSEVTDRPGGQRLVSDAFEDVFREHYGAMVRSLTVACGDREVAADGVQDAFVRAYVRWRRISRYDDPVAWVRHVALNRIRDHFRRVERGGRAGARLAGEPVADATKPPRVVRRVPSGSYERSPPCADPPTV